MAFRRNNSRATAKHASGKRVVTDSIGGPAVGSEHLDLDVYEDERGDNPRMRDSKKRLAFSVLNNTFGSPENQKRGWASEEQAANSAATLLAPRIGVSYSTALSVVREWYAGHRDNPQPWTRVFG